MHVFTHAYTTHPHAHIHTHIRQGNGAVRVQPAATASPLRTYLRHRRPPTPASPPPPTPACRPRAGRSSWRSGRRPWRRSGHGECGRRRLLYRTALGACDETSPEGPGADADLEPLDDETGGLREGLRGGDADLDAVSRGRCWRCPRARIGRSVRPTTGGAGVLP